MPSSRRTLGSLAALGAALALVLSGLVAPAARADAAQVTVVSPGGAEQTLSLEALAGSEDVVARPYVLRSDAGETTQTVTGFSLAALIDAAGADPYGFSYLEVQRPAGGTVLLSRDQALDAGAFAEGPPVVYATAAGTGFLRPATSAEDLNASDSFEAPQGVSVVLRKGMALQVKAKASTVKTQPGKPVSFSAIVERAGAGEELSYSWTFDDGHSADAAEVTHSFAKRGSYDVVVGVTSSGNEAGASAVVTVQVGEPLGGPDRKGGGRNRTADAPDHGSAAGPSGGSDSGAGSGTIAPPSVPATSAPAATTPAPPAEPAPQPKPVEPPPEPSGEEVSGELLDSTPDSAPPEPPEAQAAARTGSLDESGGGGGGLPGAAVGLLITAGLLGAGALVETRNLLR